jgi:hypothetical protein
MDGHASALGCERPRTRGAAAAGRAGDEYPLAYEPGLHERLG